MWEQLRQACNDPALSRIDKTAYIDHIRAIMAELVLIAITKNCNMDIGGDARFFTMTYFKDHGATHVEEIERTYNQAFGATPGDGVAGMVRSSQINCQTENPTGHHSTSSSRILCRAKSLFDDFKIHQTDNKMKMSPTHSTRITHPRRVRKRRERAFGLLSYPPLGDALAFGSYFW